MSAVLTEIINLLGSGISSFATQIGTGVNALVTNLFIQTVGEGASATKSLTTFGGVIIIFAGIALTIGLSKLIFNWLTSLGN